MARSCKNIPSLHRFVEIAPVEALRGLATACGAEIMALSDPSWPAATASAAQQKDLRNALLTRCTMLDEQVAAALDGHARRILTLAEAKEWVSLEAIVRERLFRHDDANQTTATDFDAQRDHIGRATVIYLRASTLFDEAEHCFHAERHHNYGRLYQAVDLDCDDVTDVHLFLIRHAGAMNSVQQIGADLSTTPHYYRPRSRRRCCSHPT